MADQEEAKKEEAIDGNLTTRYVVYTDFSGLLKDPDEEVFMDDTLGFNYYDVKHLRSLLFHKNYLPWLFYDKSNAMIGHLQYDSTVKEYIAQLKLGNIISKMIFYHPSRNGAASMLYEYVPDEYTSLIKGMIEFVVDTHKNGKSLSKFTMDNLVMKDGGLRFVKVKFPKATFNSIQADYKCICDVILSLFADGDGVIPPDADGVIPPLLKHLYDQMYALIAFDSTRSMHHELMFVNHISLMSHAQRLAFVRRCDEVSSEWAYSAYATSYTTAVSGTQSLMAWNALVRNNPDTFGPVYDCLCHFQFPKEHNFRIIRFGRNMTSHLRDYKTPHTFIGIKESDLMIMSLFGVWYADLQVQLWENDVLHHVLKDLS